MLCVTSQNLIGTVISLVVINVNCFDFRRVKVYCNSGDALAGLIREIRNDFFS